MPRRTKEQKIIAELRRQLREQSPARVQPEKPAAAKVEIALPQPAVKEVKVAPKITYDEPSFLKRDLSKFAVTMGIAAVFEIIVSYLILSGALKAVGLS